MEYMLVYSCNAQNARYDIFDMRREPLEDCRDKLPGILSDCQDYRRLNIIAVFDAHMVKGASRRKKKMII
jgi:hypothetical protein